MDSRTLRGTGVVAGIAYAPAAWTRQAPVPPQVSGTVAEEARPDEVARFKAAAETIAQRFTERASAATGVATEVLGATAALARDRGWLRAATKLISSGRPLRPPLPRRSSSSSSSSRSSAGSWPSAPPICATSATA